MLAAYEVRWPRMAAPRLEMANQGCHLQEAAQQDARRGCTDYRAPGPLVFFVLHDEPHQVLHVIRVAQRIVGGQPAAPARMEVASPAPAAVTANGSDEQHQAVAAAL
ncbi:hypothetical protein TSOC_006545 [Tetrabaena socialis]|uniref:Uncharacterized protein n=1 Tax=Tetrabaena socialis TaxID=47790 RepID=A0A2J8A3D2_9CHLO|nr:hypothetical protein TSOC_006545 [Tetrabaena socialis]|eukprot:PNH07035.1 hypothetical protein TSOC_006545 [Tetrabaena socialis]